MPEVHPEVLKVLPFGNRMVVMREEPKAFSARCPSCNRRNLTVSPDRKCAYCGHMGLVSFELPQQSRETPSVGWVVAVGPEVDAPNFPRSLGIKGSELVGQKVLFAPYGGNTLQVGDIGETLYEGRYVLIEATSVLALVEED